MEIRYEAASHDIRDRELNDEEIGAEIVATTVTSMIAEVSLRVLLYTDGSFVCSCLYPIRFEDRTEHT